MRSIVAGCLVALSSCARPPHAPAPPPPPPAVAIDPDLEATQLRESGWPHTESFHPKGSERFWTRSTIFVGAPVDRVRAVIVDYGAYARIMPRTFQRSKVLRRVGLATDVYLQAEVMNGAAIMWVEEHFAAPVAEGKGEIVIATMNKGNVDDASGFWRFRAAPGGTVVTIELSIDPAASVPDKLMKVEMERACEDAALGVRGRAEEG